MTLHSWLSFRGHVGRLEYLWKHLVLFALLFVAFVVNVWLQMQGWGALLTIVPAALFFVVSGWGLAVRRLRDVGLSMWWLLVLFVPYINLLFVGMLFFSKERLSEKLVDVFS